VAGDWFLYTHCPLEILSTYLLVGGCGISTTVVTVARDADEAGGDILLMGLYAGNVSGSLDFPDLYRWAETAT